MTRDMKMLIGGNFVNASDGGVAQNFNPYTGQLIGTVPAATKEDIDKAVSFAKEGQKNWAAMRGDEREELMENFLAQLTAHAEEVAELLCEESGKSISECRSEISLVKPIFRAYMRAASTLYGETLPANTEARGECDFIFTTYEPMGVCAAVAPFNYPISTMMNKVAPMLCARNSVIMKPASDTPMSILAVAKLMVEAGFPSGVTQVVTGSGTKVGKWFTENRDIALISLTGSTEVGVTLHRNASDFLQRLGLELGGNDPLVIFADCNMDKAIKESINGRLYNCGQVCTASKRFIVENSIREEFTSRLITKLESIHGGVPSDENSFYGCMINKKAADTVERQINDTIALGAKCLYGGRRLHPTMVEPTVLANVTKEMPIAKDMEVFGPVFPIIGFDTFDEAIEIANNTIYGLSSGIITENTQKAMRAAMHIKAGTCVVNGTGDYRTSYHPFGGCKMSGTGREGALITLKEFSEIKSVVLKGIC